MIIILRFVSINLFCYLLVACSLVKTSPKQDENISKFLHQKFQQICLSNSGKGRARLNEKKINFTHESYLDATNKTWTLALNFPIHGEEIFKLDIANKIALGSFYERIERETGIKYGNELLLKKMIAEISVLLEIIQDFKELKSSKYKCEGDQNKGQCLLNTQKKISWTNTKSTFSISISLDNNTSIHFENFLLRRKRFKRMNIYLLNNKIELVGLDLYVNECLDSH